MRPKLAVIQPTAAFHLRCGVAVNMVASQSQCFQRVKKIHSLSAAPVDIAVLSSTYK
jgi:hypothetical protein